MELAAARLAKLLEGQTVCVTFPDLAPAAQELLEASSYQALCQIREILCDSQLSDPECFQKIEGILCVFEQLGLECGDRHDFG